MDPLINIEIDLNFDYIKLIDTNSRSSIKSIESPEETTGHNGSPIIDHKDLYQIDQIEQQNKTYFDEIKTQK